ncbi:MAG: DUF222 domain-containing protein [Streptomyces sp.]|nr:DUF222 domain-containing protein [Streptomyces sp.]
MFSGSGDAGTSGAALTAAPSIDDLRDALGRLAAHDGAGLTEAEMIDHLHALEVLKSGAAAAQARITATLARERTSRETAAGVPVDQRGRGLAAEVALARQESPVRGARHLGLAVALVSELPETLAALTRGTISEWAATEVARETAVLSREDRIEVDAQLAGQFSGRSERQIAALARKIGYRLDPGSAIRRTRGAESNRRVGLRPAPDTMSYLSGHLPVAQGVACFATLAREADRARAEGDPRTRSQIMADTLVERVTGQSAATGTPVEIGLVMTDRTLLGGDEEPAHLEGYGAIPAFLGRELVREADRAWVRRLYTSPADGSLVAMDSRRRCFDGGLRRFVVIRDQTCRNSWCGAPIRHADHPVPAADGGETSADNGQGLCEACNYAKEAAGWRVRRVPGPGHVIETITPTGHRYRSRAPDPPKPPGYPLRVDLLFPRSAA